MDLINNKTQHKVEIDTDGRTNNKSSQSSVRDRINEVLDSTNNKSSQSSVRDRINEVLDSMSPSRGVLESDKEYGLSGYRTMIPADEDVIEDGVTVVNKGDMVPKYPALMALESDLVRDIHAHQAEDVQPTEEQKKAIAPDIKSQWENKSFESQVAENAPATAQAPKIENPIPFERELANLRSNINQSIYRVNQDIQREEESRFTKGQGPTLEGIQETRYRESARRTLLSVAKKIDNYNYDSVDEAGRGVVSFLSGMVESLWGAVKSTATLGLYDLKDVQNKRRVARSMQEVGEETSKETQGDIDVTSVGSIIDNELNSLSDGQKELYKAMFLEYAVNSLLEGKESWSRSTGEMTGEFLAFMAELAIGMGFIKAAGKTALMQSLKSGINTMLTKAQWRTLQKMLKVSSKVTRSAVKIGGTKVGKALQYVGKSAVMDAPEMTLAIAPWTGLEIAEAQKPYFMENGKLTMPRGKEAVDNALNTLAMSYISNFGLKLGQGVQAEVTKNFADANKYIFQKLTQGKDVVPLSAEVIFRAGKAINNNVLSHTSLATMDFTSKAIGEMLNIAPGGITDYDTEEAVKVLVASIISGKAISLSSRLMTPREKSRHQQQMRQATLMVRDMVLRMHPGITSEQLNIILDTYQRGVQSMPQADGKVTGVLKVYDTLLKIANNEVRLEKVRYEAEKADLTKRRADLLNSKYYQSRPKELNDALVEINQEFRNIQDAHIRHLNRVAEDISFIIHVKSNDYAMRYGVYELPVIEGKAEQGLQYVSPLQTEGPRSGFSTSVGLIGPEDVNIYLPSVDRTKSKINDVAIAQLGDLVSVHIDNAPDTFNRDAVVGILQEAMAYGSLWPDRGVTETGIENIATQHKENINNLLAGLKEYYHGEQSPDDVLRVLLSTNGNDYMERSITILQDVAPDGYKRVLRDLSGLAISSRALMVGEGYMSEKKPKEEAPETNEDLKQLQSLASDEGVIIPIKVAGGIGYVKSGKIVLSETGELDKASSDEEIYYVDDKGETQVIGINMLSIDKANPLFNQTPEAIIASATAPTETNINIGTSVTYRNAEGAERTSKVAGIDEAGSLALEDGALITPDMAEIVSHDYFYQDGESVVLDNDEVAIISRNGDGTYTASTATGKRVVTESDIIGTTEEIDKQEAEAKATQEEVKETPQQEQTPQETPAEEINYEELAVTDPMRFVAEYDKVFGEGAGMSALEDTLASLEEQVESKRATLSTRGISLNDKVKTKKELDSIYDKINVITSALPSPEKPLEVEESPKEEVAEVEVEPEKKGIDVIRDKWTSAPKSMGVKDEIVLPNGDKLEGRYVMTEAGVATPSHNPHNNFSMSEGFPVTEQGTTINDRDYANDKAAQAIVEKRSASYDQRAVINPVVVSQDGVVYSGNDRSMAGELAAKNGTDDAYIEYIRKYGDKYGFPSEEVAKYEHPRVLFVPDEVLPYTTEVFGRFNAKETKSQNKTERAIKIGKSMQESTVNKITNILGNYEKMQDYFSNDREIREVINILVGDGMLGENEVAELYDNGRLSMVGKDYLETIFIGMALPENSVRMSTEYPSIRQALLSAITVLADNRRLPNGYALTEELEQAITTLYRARKGGVKQGEGIGDYLKQTELFSGVVPLTGLVANELALKLNSKSKTAFRDFIDAYNKEARAASQGQVSIFSGKPLTRQDIMQALITASPRFQITPSVGVYGVELTGHPESIFESNAMLALNGIKQNKATGAQWLAMLQKAGGIKAGEDKWIGLSDFLTENKERSLTRDEVAEYIANNGIRLEEVRYGEAINDNLDEPSESALRILNDSMMSPGVKSINSTRLRYTTEGLSNKKELAFVVPIIEPWNQNDNVHFGDAGEGRTVGWVRFGDANITDGDNHQRSVLMIDEIQSKRHQEAREKGYLTEEGKRYKELESKLFSLREQIDAINKNIEESKMMMVATPLMISKIRSIHSMFKFHFGLYFTKIGLSDKSTQEDIDTREHEIAKNIRYIDNHIEYYPGLQAEINHTKQLIKEYEDAKKELLTREEYENRVAPLKNERALLATEYNELKESEERQSLKDTIVGDEVQMAPFEKNWAELIMKRMLRYAAENGYSRIAWTTGAQQADRYNTSTYMDTVKLTKREDGSYLLNGENNGVDVYGGIHTAEELSNLIGKEASLRWTKIADAAYDKVQPLREAADNLRSQADKEGYIRVTDHPEYGDKWEKLQDDIAYIERECTHSGEDLAIGGEGMKAFYDVMLPSFVNKYGKKWGVNVEDISVPVGGGITVHSVKITEEMKNGVMKPQPLFQVPDNQLNLIAPRINHERISPLIDRLKETGLAKDVILVKDEAELSKYISIADGIKVTIRGRVAAATDSNGNIVIVENNMRLDTAFHEYCHKLWSYAKNEKKESVLRGLKKIADGAPEHIKEYVRKNYPTLGYEAYLDEVFAWHTASKSQGRLQQFLKERGLDKRTSSEQLQDYEWYRQMEEEVRDLFKGMVKEFIKSNPTPYGVTSATLSHVDELSVFDAYDEMSADELINAVYDVLMSGKRKQLKDDTPVEVMNQKGTESLIAVHNITSDKLRGALSLGGLANPSMAVYDTALSSHEGYGEISFILPSEKLEGVSTFSRDAWTPKFPRVEYSFSDKARAKYQEILKPIEDAELKDAMGWYLTAYLNESGPTSSPLAPLFLQEKGIPFTPSQRQGKYRNQIHHLAERIFGGEVSKEAYDKLSKDQKAEFFLLINGKLRGVELESMSYVDAIKERINNNKQRLSLIKDNPDTARAIINMVENRLAENEALLELAYESDMTQVAMDMYQDKHSKRDIDAYGTFDKAEMIITEQGMLEEFRDWQDSVIDEIAPDKIFFSHWTPDGDRKYKPYTLDEVSKWMKKQGLNASDWDFQTGMEYFLSHMVKKMKSRSAIRKNRSMLVSYEVMREWSEKTQEIYHDAFWGVMNDGALPQKYSDDYIVAEQVAFEIMQDVIVKKRPISAVEKEYKVTLSDATRQAISDFNKEAQSAVDSYFETKFQRPVYFNEFALAVVPKDLAQSLKDKLKEQGLEVREYDPTVEGHRSEVIDEAVRNREDVLFQLIGEYGARSYDAEEETTIRIDNLNVARSMEKEGKDIVSIRYATGWERGADGKWRYEIMDDFSMVILPIDKYTTLKKEYEELQNKYEKYSYAIPARVPSTASPQERERVKKLRKEFKQIVKEWKSKWLEVIEAERAINFTEIGNLLGDAHPLFRAYPSLRKMQVSFQDRWHYVKEGYQGMYTGSHIWISPYATNPISTLAHEIQHAIQHIEGFARGGNISSVETRAFLLWKDANPLWDMMDASPEWKERRALMDKLLRDDITDSQWKEITDRISTLDNNQEVQKILKRQSELLRQYGYTAAVQEILSKRTPWEEEPWSNLLPYFHDPYDAYHSLAGEVEARNVSKRINMTPEERRATILKDTEDVHRREQILLLEGGYASADVADVLDTAIEDGTYLKAPNGKESNLSGKPTTWAQIRTEPFKEWFGDWELLTKSVKTVYVNNTIKFKNFKDARKWAKNEIVGFVIHPEIGDIYIGSASIDKMLSQNAVKKSDGLNNHLSLLPYLPEVIKSSIVGEIHSDRAANEHIRDIVRLFGAVSIKGEIYRVKSTVKRYVNTNEKTKAYSYEVTKIELFEGTLEDDKNNPLPRSSNNSISTTKLLKGVKKNNSTDEFLCDISKIVDENGEPLIVYHGSGKWFEAFDPTAQKHSGAYDNTFYFTDNKEIANSFVPGRWYGLSHGEKSGMANEVVLDPDSPQHPKYSWGTHREGGIYSVFLNMRNPLVVDFKGKAWYDIGNGDSLDDIAHKTQQEGKYDGVIAKNIKDVGHNDYRLEKLPNVTVYVTFKPEQAKSATQNVGTFDSDNPTLRFRRMFMEMTNEEIYDALNENAEYYGMGPARLMTALEEKYGGELIGASSGARRALEDGLVPLPGSQYSGLDGEYHHMRFRNNEGEEYVVAVPFGTPEMVRERGIMFRPSEQLFKEPTEAQKKAGNYKMEHLRRGGYNISIENPKGSVRRGVDENGVAWENEMPYDYGYIRGTKGKDGDHIDIFLGPIENPLEVYVVDQVDPKTGKFDESKVMFGFESIEEARRAYEAAYDKDWKGLKSITATSKEVFDKWIDTIGKQGKPFAEYVIVEQNKTGDEVGPLDRYATIAESISSKSGRKINIVLSLEEIKGEDPHEVEKKRRSMGYYDIRTGEITVVLPNIPDEGELRKTITHEALGHGDIRAMLGDKADDFFESVYRWMDKDTRAKYKGYSHKEAAEEYVAEMAETYVQPTIWARIKAMFLSILRKIGLYHKMSDADIRYYLYKAAKYGKKRSRMEETKVKATEYELSRAVKGESRYRIVGEKGVNSIAGREELYITDNLDLAKELHSRGVDDNTIIRSTGWERGIDGKWRYEKSDTDMRMNLDMMTENALRARIEVLNKQHQYDETISKGVDPISMEATEMAMEVDNLKAMYEEQYGIVPSLEEVSKKEITRAMLHMGVNLGELLKASKVMEEYPVLREYTLTVNDFLPESTSASTDTYTKNIMLSSALFNDYTPIEVERASALLMHEIQHVIQEEEGFISGGSTVGVAKLKHLLKEKIDIATGRELTAQGSLVNMLANKEVMERYLPVFDIVATENGFSDMEEMVDFLMEEDYDSYARLAGEVEARRVERRRWMTAEEIKQVDEVYREEISRAVAISTQGNLMSEDSRSYRRFHLISEVNRILASTDRVSQGVKRHLVVQYIKNYLTSRDMYNFSKGDLARIMTWVEKAPTKRDFNHALSALYFEVARLGYQQSLRKVRELKKKKLEGDKNGISQARKVDASTAEFFKLFIAKTAPSMRNLSDPSGALSKELYDDSRGEPTGIEVDLVSLSEALSNNPTPEIVMRHKDAVYKKAAIELAIRYEDALDIRDMIMSRHEEIQRAWADAKSIYTRYREQHNEYDAERYHAKMEWITQQRTALSEEMANLSDEMESIARELNLILQDGITTLQNELIARENERVENIKRALLSIGSKEYRGEATRWTDKINKLGVDVWHAIYMPIFNMANTLRFISGRRYPEGKSPMWRYYVEQGMKASENYYNRTTELARKIEDKSIEIFNLRYKDIQRRAQQTLLPVYIEDSAVEAINAFSEGGREHHSNQNKKGDPVQLSVDAALYIIGLTRNPDIAARYEARGVTETEVANIKRALLEAENGDKYLALLDWIQYDLIPSTRGRYNATFRQLNGRNMAYIVNYLPLKIRKSDQTPKQDALAGNQATARSVEETGHIKSRQQTIAIPSLTMGILEYLPEYIQKMEEWDAYSLFGRSVNDILKSKEFRNRLEANMPGMYMILAGAFQVSTGAYTPAQELNNKIYKFLEKARSRVVGANIAYNMIPAIKQLLSYPSVFDSYNTLSFYKMMVKYSNPVDNIKWVMDGHLPLLKKRWEEGLAGYQELQYKGDGFLSGKLLGVLRDLWVKKKGDLADWVLSGAEFLREKGGMLPNRAIDVFTCAMVARPVYEETYNRMVARGATEAEAKKEAEFVATLTYNASQQSNERWLTSPMQSELGYGKMITTYQTTNIQQQALLQLALMELAKSSKEERENLYTKYYNDYREKGYSDEVAKKKAFSDAKKDLREIKRKATINVFLYSYMMKWLWRLGGVMFSFILKGEDEEKYVDKALTPWQSLIDGAGQGSAWWIPLELAMGAWQARQEVEIRPDMLADFVNDNLKEFKDEENDWEDRAFAALNLMHTYDTGIDLRKLRNMFLSLSNMPKVLKYEKGGRDLVLQILNLSPSQRKRILMQKLEGETYEDYRERVSDMSEILYMIDIKEDAIRTKFIEKMMEEIAEDRGELDEYVGTKMYVEQTLKDKGISKSGSFSLKDKKEEMRKERENRELINRLKRNQGNMRKMTAKVDNLGKDGYQSIYESYYDNLRSIAKLLEVMDD